MPFVSRLGHAFVNTRPSLPEEWAWDCARRKEAGVPNEIKLHTRHERALEILDGQGSLLPHAWVEGDVENGRSSG